MISNIPTEIEIAVIIASLDEILEITNPTILKIVGTSPDQNVSFHNSIAQKYFFINLLDFISNIDENLFSIKKKTILEFLIDVLSNPKLSRKSHSKKALSSTKKFKQWLEKEISVRLWIPNLKKNFKIKIRRKFLIRFSGNYCKHRFVRLGSMADLVKSILKISKNEISPNDAILAFESLFESFHGNILLYHSSIIVSMLLKIQKNLLDYLIPAYKKAFFYVKNPSNSGHYSYLCPPEIQNELFKNLFFDLMNRVKNRPQHQTISINPIWKKRW